MKQYKELHHQRGNDESGAFAWVNPKEVKTVTLEEKHAEDINAQFSNTGIKLLPVTEDVDGIEMVNHVVDEQTLDMNPEMEDEGIKVGDVIQYAATEEGDAQLSAKIAASEAPTGFEGAKADISATEETPDTNQ